MKISKIAFVAVLLLAFANSSVARERKLKLKGVEAEYGAPIRLGLTPWTIGLGWNFVEDNGKWGNIFRSWNTPYFPSSLKVEKYIHQGWSGVFDFSYNTYKSGKKINGEVTHPNYLFMSFDLNAKYDFTELYDVNTQLFGLATKMFDFYGVTGLGFTMRSAPRVGNCATFNIGMGMNAIFYQGWGMNIQAMSKFGLAAPIFATPTNYLQYSIGAIYQFKSTRLGSKNGTRKRYFIARKL